MFTQRTDHGLLAEAGSQHRGPSSEPSALRAELAGERAELARVRAAYDRRRRRIPPGRYERSNPASLCNLQEREVAMADVLRAAGLISLAGLRILDLGCGRGGTLRQLLEYGAEPANLFGTDLLEEQLHYASRLAPHIPVVCANAARLPFPDGAFELVIQFTVFTSVLSKQVKQAIAAEMRRLLVDGGKLLWYDFAYNNPKNPDVRGIGKAEIRTLFPGFSMRVRRLTLAPPMGRVAASLSPALYFLLAKVRPLCTHYLCLLEKPKAIVPCPSGEGPSEIEAIR